MEENSYSGKKALIVGAARSGIAAAEFLLARGAAVVLTDTRPEDDLRPALGSLRSQAGEGRLFFELGGHRLKSFSQCDMVVVSPGVPLSLPFFEISRRSGIPVMAEVELAYRHLKGRILGITGSNGKTTTTVLVNDMLRSAGLKSYAAGNIGVPLISLATASAEGDFYATELSSFQLEGIDRFRPAVAALLNLAPDHLDRYPGFEAYMAAKRRIFLNQRSEDFAVLNADDPVVGTLAAEVKSTPFYFSRIAAPDSGSFVKEGRVIYRNGPFVEELFALEDIRLRGSHNLENVLAASTIAILAGAPHCTLREAIRSFSGVQHRLEWVTEIDGVQYFNDSKATNVDAAIKSLRAFAGGIHLIAGGRDKGADFTPLKDVVRARVKQLVLIGEAAAKLQDALTGTAEITLAADMREAVETCRRASSAGDVVLLAPACASFDMFENYEHRGRVFKEVVLALARSD